MAEAGRRRDGLCARTGPGAGECAVAELAPDAYELAALAVMRNLFSSFAAPSGHGWLAAAAEAEQQFRGCQPGERFFELLRLVQAMRRARRSPFQFSNPHCRPCAAVLTEPERHLMLALQAVRRGRLGPARMHAMLLCEGADVSAVIEAMCAVPEVWPAMRSARA